MRIAALTYHDVSSAPPRSGAERRYTVSPDRFAAHLDALETAPGRVVDLRGDERAVLLTFDDGDASAATTVAPLLASRGWPAHFFIVTSWIGEPGRVNADGIRRLHEAGHVIGSHTRTHPRLTTLDDAAVADQWRRSRAELEDLIGAPVNVASVPYGATAPRIVAAAIDAGYTHVFTSHPWIRPRRHGEATIYGRLAVVADTPSERIRRLSQLSSVTIAREATIWHARQGAKRAIGPLYTRVRERALTRRHR